MNKGRVTSKTDLVMEVISMVLPEVDHPARNLRIHPHIQSHH